jgi:hypothetical protein
MRRGSEDAGSEYLPGTEEDPEHWRAFQGTELGSMLTRLYGNAKPKINYPKPRTSNTFKPDQKFISGGSVDAVDPRKSGFNRNASVTRPKVGAGKRSPIKFAAVDLISKRRGAEVIQNEIEEIRFRDRHYRPAHQQAISSDQEKDRLNQIFTHKGGKGLPEAGTHVIGEAPFERAERVKREEDWAARRARRRGETFPALPAAKLSTEEELAMQITKEINERREYLMEMQEQGLPEQRINVVKREIAQRVRELQSLNV